MTTYRGVRIGGAGALQNTERIVAINNREQRILFKLIRSRFGFCCRFSW